MTERITVSKAAKLLGVTRAELRKRLAAAEIETFEGEVDLEEVRCIAPDLKRADQEILDRVKYLRNDASKLPRDEKVQSIHDLQAEVRRLTTQLSIETQMAGHYRAIVEDLGHELGQMQTADDPAARQAALTLCQWLRDKAING